MKNILFDSYAILKFYQDEDGADKVEKLLISIRQGALKAFISEINLGEVYYMTIRRLGLALAKPYLEQFFELSIKVVPPSSDIILSASEIKAEYAISYADCFAVATALRVEASIITGDPEFKKVDRLVKIDWI
ncbi:type II toxin-antitoxin system VapC family toxin [Thermodesulfobacteriota bacterium]